MPNRAVTSKVNFEKKKKKGGGGEGKEKPPRIDMQCKSPRTQEHREKTSRNKQGEKMDSAARPQI